MKNHQLLRDLMDDTSKVKFPEHDSTFDVYQGKMLKLLMENIGQHITDVAEFRYSPEDNAFLFPLCVQYTMPDGQRVTLSWTGIIRKSIYLDEQLQNMMELIQKRQDESKQNEKK